MQKVLNVLLHFSDPKQYSFTWNITKLILLT